jgi:hypothetical protein
MKSLWTEAGSCLPVSPLPPQSQNFLVLAGHVVFLQLGLCPSLDDAMEKKCFGEAADNLP